MNPCNVKRFYDTEFEAEIAATKASHEYGHELTHYPCGNHWHLANTDPALRSRVREVDRMYCPDCRVYMKRGRWSKHLLTKGHRKVT